MYVRHQGARGRSPRGSCFAIRTPARARRMEAPEHERALRSVGFETTFATPSAACCSAIARRRPATGCTLRSPARDPPRTPGSGPRPAPAVGHAPQPRAYGRSYGPMNPLRRYARWLHTQWPAGTVEKLPVVDPDGGTNLPGVFVAGDLLGIPLLKFALDSGARIAHRIASESPARAAGARSADALDLVIIGAGVSGMAAAIEAKRLELSFEILEAAEPFFTLVNFPKAKPIYTYPRAMKPAGTLLVAADVKEALLDELRAQASRAGVTPTRARAERVAREGSRLAVHLAGGGVLRARNVLIAIGRSGNFRKLDVPGESLPKVYNRLHDPASFAGQRVLVVGGGDTAAEAAIALTGAGAHVTLCYRGTELSRPKP